jgi:predicted nuclease of predicted toxin-antitoxin system
MKILLDHCMPKRLKRVFPAHEVKTVREMGWEGLSNGRLLAEAATAFDVMLTVDQNIKHQQNLDKLPLAVIVLIAEDNRFPTLARLANKVEDALLNLLPKTLTEISDAG